MQFSSRFTNVPNNFNDGITIFWIIKGGFSNFPSLQGPKVGFHPTTDECSVIIKNIMAENKFNMVEVEQALDTMDTQDNPFLDDPGILHPSTHIITVWGLSTTPRKSSSSHSKSKKDANDPKHNMSSYLLH
eukprot:15343318-Ditylum_brightwellii.AAC.1